MIQRRIDNNCRHLFPSTQKTVLNLNFQHLFTIFHPDSVLSLPTLFCLVVPAHADSSHCSSEHQSLLLLLPHTTSRLFNLAAHYCPIKSQQQPYHAVFNSLCLVLLQALQLEPKLMPTTNITHQGSEFLKLTLAPRSWP